MMGAILVRLGPHFCHSLQCCMVGVMPARVEAHLPSFVAMMRCSLISDLAAVAGCMTRRAIGLSLRCHYPLHDAARAGAPCSHVKASAKLPVLVAVARSSPRLPSAAIAGL